MIYFLGCRGVGLVSRSGASHACKSIQAQEFFIHTCHRVYNPIAYRALPAWYKLAAGGAGVAPAAAWAAQSSAGAHSPAQVMQEEDLSAPGAGANVSILLVDRNY